MLMIIEVASYTCSIGGCMTDGGPRHPGHAAVRIWNGTLPMWSRRPPWAELEQHRPPFDRASEALKWAVAQLDANMRAGTFPADEDDYAELLG